LVESDALLAVDLEELECLTHRLLTLRGAYVEALAVKSQAIASI